jgi:hypothetical protein
MIQNFLIAHIFSPVAGFYEKMNDKAREWVFTIAGVLLFLQYVFKDLWLSMVPYYVVFAFGTLCLVVMGLSLLKPDLKPIAYYKIPAVCWFGTGGLNAGKAILGLCIPCLCSSSLLLSE